MDDSDPCLRFSIRNASADLCCVRFGLEVLKVALIRGGGRVPKICASCGELFHCSRAFQLPLNVVTG